MIKASPSISSIGRGLCRFAAALLVFVPLVVTAEVQEWRALWPQTDFTSRTVNLKDIVASGIPKDGVPAINRPRFVSIHNAGKWLFPKEPVIAVVVKGVARAYPIQIMIYHQVVNDRIKGEPVVVTFCPLCNSGYAYRRRLGDTKLKMGITGLLRNSGLIMYDHQTKSWWQQFTGESIVGKFAGRQLVSYPSHLISFADFSRHYPKGKVLSRDTGYRRQYGLNPFRGYDSIDSSPFKFKDETDPRLPPMERVLNIRVNGVTKLYPYSVIREYIVLNDEVSKVPLVVFCKSNYVSPLDKTEILRSSDVPAAFAYSREVDGRQLSFEYVDGRIVDTQTGSVWTLLGKAVEGTFKGVQLRRVDIGVHFAFAALAFKPESEIYRSVKK